MRASALKQEVQEVKAKKENQSFLQTWKNSATLDGPLHYKNGSNAGERQCYECTTEIQRTPRCTQLRLQMGQQTRIRKKS